MRNPRDLLIALAMNRKLWMPINSILRKIATKPHLWSMAQSFRPYFCKITIKMKIFVMLTVMSTHLNINYLY